MDQRLGPAHRQQFRERDETIALARMPRIVVEQSAVELLRDTGELRLIAWLERALARWRDVPPLVIELVPSTCWWSNLRSELPAEQWEICKQWASGRADRRCGICGDKGPKWPVECHERWTYIDTAVSRIQRLDGLVALCPACHESTHMGFANVNGRQQEAMRHLTAVNNWTSAQARAHLRDAGAVWQRRSEHQWGLDVVWLKDNLGIEVKASRRPPRGH
jgi:hypothetical protein